MTRGGMPSAQLVLDYISHEEYHGIFGAYLIDTFTMCIHKFARKIF
jgi:hypothetical protein